MPIGFRVQDNTVGVRIPAKLEPIAGGKKVLAPTYAAEKEEGGRHNMTPPENGRAS